MIEVIFVVHAKEKLTTGSGIPDELPEVGLIIKMNGRNYKVLAVQTTKLKGTKQLRRPIIDITPVK